MTDRRLTALDKQTTFVYSLFDEMESLLYVGMTNNVDRRMSQHAADKPWWPEVARREVETFRDRPSALARECEKIREEQPRYNKQGVVTLHPSENQTSNDRCAAAGRFSTSSLVGSFFLSDAGRLWHGVVVAEVAPGTYLVERAHWWLMSRRDQVLVPLSEMSEWRFYDTAEWCMDAYEREVRDEWRSERQDVLDHPALVEVKRPEPEPLSSSATAEKAQLWIDLGIPLDASRRKAKEMGLVCKAAHFGAIKRLVNEKYTEERHVVEVPA